MRISFPQIQLPAVIQPYANSAKARITSALETFKQFDFQAIRPLAIRVSVVFSLVGVVAVTLYCFLRTKSGPTQSNREGQSTQGLPGPAQTAPVTPQQPKQPVHEANICLVESKDYNGQLSGSWYIYNDKIQSFGTTLKDKDGKPIPIHPTDLYFIFETSTNIPQTTNNCITLPSPLFRDVKEGDIVEFYLNDHAFRLTCRQCQQGGGVRFEDAIANASKNISCEAYAPSDVEEFGTVMQIPILEDDCVWGDQPIDVLLSQPNKEQYGAYINLRLYPLEDERYPGVKTHLVRLPDSPAKFLLPEKVKKDEISCYKFTNYSGEFILFFIPHKPELNNASCSSSNKLSVLNLETEENVQLPRDEFDCKKFRLSSYNHGRIGVISQSDVTQVEFIERN